MRRILANPLAARQHQHLMRIARLGTFLLLWVGATSCGSFVSGWRELANGHRARPADPGIVLFGGDTIHLDGGRIPFTYQHCVEVRTDTSGITIVQSFPFRSFAPSMHIQWADLASCDERSSSDRSDAVLRVRGSSVAITVHDGEEVLRLCHQQQNERVEIMNVGGDVTTPVAVHREQPMYDACLHERVSISGPLLAEVIVDATGNVQDVQIVKTVHPCLDRTFKEALRRWKFRPARHRGVPVPVRIHFTANIDVR